MIDEKIIEDKKERFKLYESIFYKIVVNSSCEKLFLCLGDNTSVIINGHKKLKLRVYGGYKVIALNSKVSYIKKAKFVLNKQNMKNRINQVKTAKNMGFIVAKNVNVNKLTNTNGKQAININVKTAKNTHLGNVVNITVKKVKNHFIDIVYNLNVGQSENIEGYNFSSHYIFNYNCDKVTNRTVSNNSICINVGNDEVISYSFNYVISLLNRLNKDFNSNLSICALSFGTEGEMLFHNNKKVYAVGKIDKDILYSVKAMQLKKLNLYGKFFSKFLSSIKKHKTYLNGKSFFDKIKNLLGIKPENTIPDIKLQINYKLPKKALIVEENLGADKIIKIIKKYLKGDITYQDIIKELRKFHNKLFV